MARIVNFGSIQDILDRKPYFKAVFSNSCHVKPKDQDILIPQLFCIRHTAQQCRHIDPEIHQFISCR